MQKKQKYLGMKGTSIQQILKQFGQDITCHNDLIDVLSEVNQIEPVSPIEIVADFVRHCHGRVCFLGNGGSSMTARHVALDLVSCGFEVFSLPETGELTALSNDCSFDEALSIFLKRRRAFCRGIIFLSVSGNSANLINAARTAVSLKMDTMAITGFHGTGLLNEVCRYAICVRSEDYQFVEAVHHLLLAATVQSLRG